MRAGRCIYHYTPGGILRPLLLTNTLVVVRAVQFCKLSQPNIMSGNLLWGPRGAHGLCLRLTNRPQELRGLDRNFPHLFPETQVWEFSQGSELY